MLSNFRSRFMVALAMLLFATAASGICTGDANITVEANTAPDVPNWKYTLTIEWSYSDYGMLIWNIPIDLPSGDCGCSDFETDITIPEMAGSSVSSLDGCTVPYTGKLECGAESTIPFWTILTFEPDPSVSCEMPDGGTSVFHFLSDHPPVSVAEDALVTMEYGCGIHVTGVFPSFACNPISVESSEWGTIKSYYR